MFLNIGVNVIQQWNNSGTLWLIPYTSNGFVPDSLIFVSNDIGGNTAIAYQPSSAFWSSSNSCWYLPFITQIVSCITVVRTPV